MQAGLQQFLAQRLWGRQKGCFQLPVFWCSYPCAAARVAPVCGEWGAASFKAGSDPRVTTAELCPASTWASGRSENKPGEVGWSWAWDLFPCCRRVSVAGQWGWGDAMAPQLCLCAGSAAGSVPAAVSLWLHPAVTWHRAQVLGWKVLVS